MPLCRSKLKAKAGYITQRYGILDKKIEAISFFYEIAS